MNHAHTSLRRTAARGLRAGALVATVGALAGLLAGCAAPTTRTSSQTTPIAAASYEALPVITVPPTSVGTWVDLGAERTNWLAGDAPVPISGPNAPTRVAGLRRDDGRWLAIVVVQTAPSGTLGAACPQTNTLTVPLVGTGPGDCLRMRRTADADRWLQTQHGVLWNWLQERGWQHEPRAWIAHRVDNGSRVAEAHALVDPQLIEAVSRTGSDFLHAGLPGVTWARHFADAVRGIAAGPVLSVPPFPYAAPLRAVTPLPANVVRPAPRPFPRPMRAPPARADRE